MALHQYIGARYVPKFYQNSINPASCDWESNVTYEPLTIVTTPNDHCYISKKTVPDTVGTPADNSDYWLETGNFNAYIQQLQDQIDDINDVLSPLSETVSEHTEEIETKQTKVFHKAIIVGDSWAVGYYDGVGHPGQGWGDYACPLLGITDPSNILTIASGGSGFCNGTGEHFDAQILRAYNDYPAFHDADLILCVGGFNDAQDNQSYDSVKAAAGSFFSRCATYFPNAETHMFPLQLPFMSPMTPVRSNVLEGIKTGFFNSARGNLFYHEGVHLWANEYGAGASAGDGAHLNQYGYNYLGQKIAELVRRGGDYYPTLHGTFDLASVQSYIDDTQNNIIIENGDCIYTKLAIHVNNLPSTAKIGFPWFAKTTQNHFIQIDANHFFTIDSTGMNINTTYSGWLMLEHCFLAGMI